MLSDRKSMCFETVSVDQIDIHISLLTVTLYATSTYNQTSSASQLCMLQSVKRQVQRNPESDVPTHSFHYHHFREVCGPLEKQCRKDYLQMGRIVVR